jgi:hypothetical protein
MNSTGSKALYRSTKNDICRVALLVFLVLILTVESIAQRREAHIPKGAGTDTTTMYIYQQELCKKLGLREVLHDTCNDHVRLWWDTKVVDVCKNGYDVTAQLIRWTEEITLSNEPPTGRVFKQILSLDAKALQIDSLIHQSKINDLPDQSEINGWSQGFDGTAYMIEYTADSAYYFKWYWSPDAQKGIREAVVVKQFMDGVMAIVETPEGQQQFTASIPFQCWTNGGISMGCRVLTKKQARKYKRERDHYRKAMKQEHQK